MANIKPEETENTLWQSYSLQTPTSASTHPPLYEPNYPSGPGPSASPSYGRTLPPQRGNYRSMDIPTMNRPPLLPPRDRMGGLTASPPGLGTHHSFPSLKRSYTEDSPYGEVVQDFREGLPEVPKPSISQDHRLLAFSKLPDKRAIVDNLGRSHSLELIAQIHGMFFLSEMASPSTDGLLAQPELTCYRRNLFQISGTVTTPRGPLSVITERSERVPIVSMDVTISASESVDGHAVKLIVIPWKTPPPNSPEVGTGPTPGQEHEPAPLPLLTFDENGPDANSDFSVYPIAYRRLQFRIATANNGRRRELQQHFTLHLNVVATLANGGKINICETSTAPIVVRGRSPRNFQARKEIPLVGSSSSRGGPPELHVSTSVAPGISPLSAPAGKPRSAKPQAMELPRSASFNFDASNLPPSPALMRTQTYPNYMPSHGTENTAPPETPAYQAPMGLDNYLQVNHTSAEIPHSISPTTTMPRSQSQSQYSYNSTTSSAQMVAPIRFIDNNSRPAKSPRHIPPPEALPQPPYPDYGARFAPPYSSSADVLPPRDPGYFPSSMPGTQQHQQHNQQSQQQQQQQQQHHQQPWTSAPSDPIPSSTYGSSIQAPPSNLQQHYQFPVDSYVKEENNHSQQNYTWNHS